ncbi:MAG: lysylphosphatidylglycerol synthase domain-containing protein [Nocardioides sp.]
MAETGSARRARGAVFLVAVLAFGWLGLRGRFDEVGAALLDTSPGGVAAGLALVLAGLSATGLLWLRLMSRLGRPLPPRDGLAVFFVGQLGKYLPGSVWSIGAQADLARRHAVAARVTVAVGLLFLGYHLATAVLFAAGAFLFGGLSSPWPDWVSAVALVAAAVGLAPGIVRRLGTRVAGRELRHGGRDTVVAVGLMSGAWTAYAGALVLLSPDRPWRELAALGGAFAAAYAAGVVVVFAPAGVGVREAVFVLMLAGSTGVGAATALVLLARVVHTAADALLAVVWSVLARRSGSDPDHANGSASRSSVLPSAREP